MKNKLIVGIVAVLVVLGVIALAKPADQDKTNVIKIGVIAPLQGGAAVFGNSLVKGIELAKQDLEAGKLSGLSSAKYKYELVIEDDESNTARSASAAQKLVNIDKVSAIITTTSVTGNAAKPVAEAAKIPHICVCSDISIGDAAYNFTNSLLPQDEMEGWLAEAQKRDVHSVVVLHQNHPGINGSLVFLESLAEKHNIKILYKDSFDGANRDFKTIANKASKTKADMYFVAAYPPALDILSKELVVFGIQNISTYALFPVSPTPELYNDKWYTDAFLADESFAERFAAQFPSIKFNVRTAPYGYDSFVMMVKAFENDKEHPTQVLAGITSMDGKSGNITKDSSSNFRTAPGTWMIQDGKAVLVK